MFLPSCSLKNKSEINLRCPLDITPSPKHICIFFPHSFECQLLWVQSCSYWSQWNHSHSLQWVRHFEDVGSLRWLAFVAATPPGGQREGDFHFQGHFLPWHTDSGIWQQIPPRRQALHSPSKPVKPQTLSTGTHLWLSGHSNLSNFLNYFPPVSPHSLVPMHLGFFLRIWVQNPEHSCQVYSQTRSLTQFTSLPCKQLCQHRTMMWTGLGTWSGNKPWRNVQGLVQGEDPISSNHAPKIPQIDSPSQLCALMTTLHAVTQHSYAAILLLMAPCTWCSSIWAGADHIAVLHLKAGGQGRLHTPPWHQKNF